MRKRFVAYYYFNGWFNLLNIGLNICLTQPSIEIHLPGGFIRIGWVCGRDYPTLALFGWDEDRGGLHWGRLGTRRYRYDA